MEKIPDTSENSLSKIDTRKLTDLIEEYNYNFGMGKTMAREIISAARASDESFTEQKADEILTLDEMRDQLKLVLDATGIDLVSAQAGWITVSGNESHVGSTLRVDLKDGKKFVTYLQSLDQEQISENQVMGLEKIISALTRQFQKEYNLDSANDDRVLELLGNLGAIINEYKRLGENSHENLIRAVSQFENYLSAARGGYLREYRNAEDLLLTKPFNGDGFILRWHIDATPRFLEEHWNSVIDTLQKISQNNKAVELYEQAVVTAREALESALKEVSENTGTKDERETKINKEFFGILEKTKARLQEF